MTDNTENRIRLAEAMNLRVFTCDCDWSAEIKRTDKETCPQCREPLRVVSFDPFTDANDDYAVLEWMRKQAEIDGISLDQWASFVAGPFHAIDYQIGDYARAALKVLDND